MRVIPGCRGAMVSSLPQGMKPSRVDGAAYSNYGTTWIRVHYSGSQTA
jgi:hypothetical protein